jgi:8-oxo-dGTP diphosphatase
MSAQYGRNEHAVIAVDIVIFTLEKGVLKALFLEPNKPEYKNMWALPGALVHSEEGLETAVQRVLQEKAHLPKLLIDQLATFGEPQRDPYGRVVSVAYMAFLHEEEYAQYVQQIHEHKQSWLSVPTTRPLAYDHALIVKTAVARLRSKVGYTNIAQGLLPKHFTLTHLQSVYEAILGIQMDKRNFRRKVLEVKLVEDTGKKLTGGKNRPAALFAFSSKKLIEVSLFG